MVDFKEIALYAIIAIVVIAVVVVIFATGILKGSYAVNVSLSQLGSNVTYPYQTVYYEANISNRGSGQINNMLVSFYLNGVQESSQMVSIPAGRSVSFRKNYTYSSPGPYSLDVVTDPGHVMNIADRTAAQNAITTNVSRPSLPDVYSSIPNSNISSTQSFTFDEQGIISSSAIAQRYNITLVNRFFGPDQGVSAKIFQNIYPFTANIYGAWAEYNGNSIAYTAWMQGTINPAIIEAVISSFGTRIENVSTSSGTVGFAEINRTTSMCVFYSGGWTKMISYYNNSKSPTCATIAASQYNSNESAVLLAAIKNNSELTHFQSGFFYLNSSSLGSSLTYSKTNVTATNLFSTNFRNGSGIFISSIKHVGSAINVSAAKNSTCFGLIYTSNTLSVCSYFIPTRSSNYSALPFGMINTSYITPNYIINMYSLVNNTQLISAHENAAHLISLLGVNESSVVWNPVYKSGCHLTNQSSNSIGCVFDNFAYTNATAYFNITNGLPGSIRINRMNCELVGGYQNVTVNKTIAAYSSNEFAEPCNAPAVPISSIETSYELLINYTYKNTTRIINGTFNVSNQDSI
jgi:hypothetical protein